MHKRGRVWPVVCLTRGQSPSPSTKAAGQGGAAYNHAAQGPHRPSSVPTGVLAPRIPFRVYSPWRNRFLRGDIPRSFLLLKWLAHFGDFVSLKIGHPGSSLEEINP